MSRFLWPLPFIASFAFLITSCAPREVHVPTQPAPAQSMYWIDLQSGWRVRVVTPIVRSGGHFVEGLPVIRSTGVGGSDQRSSQTSNGGTITLNTGKASVGYEVSFYAVKPLRAGGVQVVFRTAVIHQDGEKTVRSHPIVPLFQLPRNETFVRVVHLAWGDRRSHEAAILATRCRDLLDEFTRQVQSHLTACKNTSDVYCSWVPAGVAVIPEHREGGGTNEQWVPAY
jgi:hypothetical protein